MLLQFCEFNAAFQAHLTLSLITLMLLLNVLLEQRFSVAPDEADPTSNGFLFRMVLIIVLAEQCLACSLVIAILTGNFEIFQPIRCLWWLRMSGQMLLEAFVSHNYHSANGTSPFLMDRFALHVPLESDARFELPTANCAFWAVVFFGMRFNVLFQTVGQCKLLRTLRAL